MGVMEDRTGSNSKLIMAFVAVVLIADFSILDILAIHSEGISRLQAI